MTQPMRLTDRYNTGSGASSGSPADITFADTAQQQRQVDAGMDNNNTQCGIWTGHINADGVPSLTSTDIGKQQGNTYEQKEKKKRERDAIKTIQDLERWIERMEERLELITKELERLRCQEQALLQLQELINAGQVNADNIHDLIPLMMQAGYREQAAEKLADDYKDGKITNQDLAQDVDETRQTLQQEIEAYEQEQVHLNEQLLDAKNAYKAAISTYGKNSDEAYDIKGVYKQLKERSNEFNQKQAVELEEKRIELATHEARQSAMSDDDIEAMQRNLIAKIEDDEVQDRVKEKLQLEDWQEQKPAQISFTPN